ncbi:MAG: preprotein translocase subunit SecE [Candidatus Gastranaerophilales bacterium]|nr:preprotein translocase subunit SecE [Candidatus Gastranaerophilales bacterium]
MANEKQNFKNKLITYLRGVKAEWSKVSWPTKKQVVAETIIVLIVVTFFTLVVFLMDKIFISLLGLIK